MTIYVFGDSYCDQDRYWEEKTKSWVTILGEKLDSRVINFAKSGRGPQYSFKYFYMVKDEIQKDCTILFCLSERDRIEFDTEIINQSFGYNFDTKQLWSNDSDFYNSNKDCIDFFYKQYHEELLYSNLKNVGYLKMFSEINQIKVAVLLCFREHWFDEYKDKLNTEHFKLYDKVLSEISYSEFYNASEMFNGKDIRQNHLSSPNHSILAHNIYNLIENDSSREPYKQKFRDYNTTYKKSKFIYS